LKESLLNSYPRNYKIGIASYGGGIEVFTSSLGWDLILIQALSNPTDVAMQQPPLRPAAQGVVLIVGGVMGRIAIPIVID
jgi:hypothetical protein